MRTEESEEEIRSQMKDLLSKKKEHKYKILKKKNFREKHFEQWRSRNEMKETLKHLHLDRKREEIKK